jgi:hypothetical protein
MEYYVEKNHVAIFQARCNAELMLTNLPMDVERWKEKTLILDG